MKSFEFSERVVPIEIRGKEYKLPYTKQALGLQRKFAEESAELDKQIKAGNKTEAELPELSRRFVDSLLGDGSFDEIFGGREFSAVDMAELLLFFADAVNDHRKGEWAKLNRAQRRAVQK